jgi:hypothetical protein
VVSIVKKKNFSSFKLKPLGGFFVVSISKNKNFPLQKKRKKSPLGDHVPTYFWANDMG